MLQVANGQAYWAETLMTKKKVLWDWSQEEFEQKTELIQLWKTTFFHCHWQLGRISQKSLWWGGFSSKWLFIEVAFHQSSFSSKQLFIKCSQKWLIHQMNEWLVSMKWQQLFIFFSIHQKHSKTCPYGYSMKSRFDEKPLWWKAALMKSRFDEKPLWWKAASTKSCPTRVFVLGKFLFSIVKQGSNQGILTEGKRLRTVNLLAPTCLVVLLYIYKLFWASM